MFVRPKKSGRYEYLQVVHNQRVDGKVHQSVIATLGRLDILQKTGQIDALIRSCSRFAEHVGVLDAHQKNRTQEADSVKIGPPLVFERLWQEAGLPRIIERLLCPRKFEFAIERTIFLTVLHRLFAPGSDRAAELWRQGYKIRGAQGLQLHHLYRAMAWLGQVLPGGHQLGAVPFAPRCTKDLIEEALFESRRNLFSSLDLVFFDTTSIYFEGEGGESIGQYGHSKDHIADCKQMVIGAVMDEQGWPICCELWPGNTADVRTVIPVIDRLRDRFHIGSICVVADRGMISKESIEKLKESRRDCRFILGARMRNVKEVCQQVLSRGGRYHVVRGPRSKSKEPSPLKVKEVWVEDRRYIVCHNEEQAKKDRSDREAIVAALRDKLKAGQKALVGNKGYRKYLKRASGSRGLEIDEEKIKAESRFDGKWVLQTDTEISASQVAQKYKELWMVEGVFRSLKSILKTRPIYHRCDETIRGHVFCSFLALVLLKELQARMAARGWVVEWERVKSDLESLQEFTVQTKGKRFTVRSRTKGPAGKAIQAAGIALGPTVREADEAR
jgi:transposase